MNEAKDQRSIDSSLQMMKGRYCLGEYISPQQQLLLVQAGQ